jgi:hypothetical protein
MAYSLPGRPPGEFGISPWQLKTNLLSNMGK